MRNDTSLLRLDVNARLSLISTTMYSTGMTPPNPPGRADGRLSLRDRTSMAVRTEVTAVALELILEQGFDKTTIDQIAAEAGLSRASFFRYFPTKEDVALGNLDELGRRVLDALTARPADESAWQALRHALSLNFHGGDLVPEARVPRLKLARMMSETPSLMSRYLQHRLSWQVLLIPETARRLGIADPARSPRPRALVAAALACQDAAIATWVATDGTTDISALLDEAMGVVPAADEAGRTEREP